jgi:hypothetical protein
VDFSNFVDISSGQRLVGFSRLRSNWVIEQARLLESGEGVVLHRIGSRRIIFEVSASAGTRRDLKRVWIVWPAICLVIAAAIANVALRTTSQSAAVIPRATPISCDVSSAIGESISELENFSAGEWSFQATDNPLVIGEFASINGEAKCGATSMTFAVLANRQSDTWRIKKMAPVKDRDH